jgi:hypothetical protein
MADADVTITAGTGTKIDTRTVGAGTDEHRQVVVIGDPTTAGGVAAVDATFGLEVDVSRVVPGTGAANLGKAEDSAHADGDTGILILGVRNHLTGSSTDGDYSAISVSSTGEMQTLARRDLVRLQSAITFTGSPPAAYVSGDQFGALVTLTGAARLSGGTGTITGVTINSASVLIGAFDVLFFESTVGVPADSGAFTITDADGLKLIGIVPLSGAYSLGANRISQAFNVAVPYVCVGGTSLFAAIITRSAFTLAAGDFTSNISVFVERN